MSYYKAVWDSRTWLMTIFVGAILVVVASLLVKPAITTRHYGALAGFAAIVVLLLGSALVFGPRGYELDQRALNVCTWLARFKFDLARLREAAERSRTEVFPGGTLRTFGCGGFFGYFGYFRNPDWGKFLAFVTSRQELVVLRFAERTLVISPHDREGFLREIRTVLDRLNAASA